MECHVESIPPPIRGGCTNCLNENLYSFSAPQYITTVLDSGLLNDGGGQILQSLDSMEVQYEIKKLPVQSTVGWMRDHVEYVVGDDCQVCYGNIYPDWALKVPESCVRKLVICL